MLDELSSLVADAAELTPELESASSSLPAADFTASLDYIDSLPSRSIVSISQRDAAGIATAASTYDYLSPLLSDKAVLSRPSRAVSLSDFRPLQDGRLFHPQGFNRRPAALDRASADIVSPSRAPARNFPPGWVNPLDPTRSPGDLERSMRDIERRARRRSPFANQFRSPDRVAICLRRRMRRSIMHAMGFAGSHYIRRPRYNMWSWVIC